MIATHVSTLPSPLPHALHLVSSLPLLMYLLVRQEHLIHTKLESDVKAARMKLGKKSEKETRRDVECDVLGGELGMELVELLKEVAAHPSVEESVRREVEIRECEFWRKLVGVLPYVSPSARITRRADVLVSSLPSQRHPGRKQSPQKLLHPHQTTAQSTSHRLRSLSILPHRNLQRPKRYPVLRHSQTASSFSK